MRSEIYQETLDDSSLETRLKIINQAMFIHLIREMKNMTEDSVFIKINELVSKATKMQLDEFNKIKK